MGTPPYASTRLLLPLTLLLAFASAAPPLPSSDRPEASTTPALPDPLVVCDPSSPRRLVNKTGFPHFWHEGLSFLPCLNAQDYNVAIFEQVQERLDKGNWRRDGEGFTIENGRENVYKKTSIQFALTLAGNSNVTIKELYGLFGKQFDQVKCLKTRESSDFAIFGCEEAALSDSFNEPWTDNYTKSFFQPNPQLYMKYIQAKTILYALLFSEHRETIRRLIITGRTGWRTFGEIYRQSVANDREGMENFFVERCEMRIMTPGEKAHMIMNMIDEFLHIFTDCYLFFKPSLDNKREECLVDYFLFHGNWMDSYRDE